MILHSCHLFRANHAKVHVASMCADVNSTMQILEIYKLDIPAALCRPHQSCVLAAHGLHRAAPGLEYGRPQGCTVQLQQPTSSTLLG